MDTVFSAKSESCRNNIEDSFEETGHLPGYDCNCGLYLHRTYCLPRFAKIGIALITSTKRKGKLLHKMQLEVASKFKTLYGGLCQCDNLDEQRLMKHAKDAVQHLSLSIMFYSPVRFRKRRLCGVFGIPEIALSSGYQQIDTRIRKANKDVNEWIQSSVISESCHKGIEDTSRKLEVS